MIAVCISTMVLQWKVSHLRPFCIENLKVIIWTKCTDIDGRILYLRASHWHIHVYTCSCGWWVTLPKTVVVTTPKRHNGEKIQRCHTAENYFRLSCHIAENYFWLSCHILAIFWAQRSHPHMCKVKLLDRGVQIWFSGRGIEKICSGRGRNCLIQGGGREGDFSPKKWTNYKNKEYITFIIFLGKSFWYFKEKKYIFKENLEVFSRFLTAQGGCSLGKI